MNKKAHLRMKWRRIRLWNNNRRDWTNVSLFTWTKTFRSISSQQIDQRESPVIDLWSFAFFELSYLNEDENEKNSKDRQEHWLSHAHLSGKLNWSLIFLSIHPFAHCNIGNFALFHSLSVHLNLRSVSERNRRLWDLKWRLLIILLLIFTFFF